MANIDLTRFRIQLAETIAWCSTKVSFDDPRNSLRTPELRPHPLSGSEKDVVDSVSSARHAELSWPALDPSGNLGGGRLLLYQPSGNLACGAAEEESDGFFDIDNIPPWDSWVWYVANEGESTKADTYHNYLISWVPEILVTLVDGGVRTNPEACIAWLDGVNTPFVQALRALGLLD